jgi:hypothetical protein
MGSRRVESKESKVMSFEVDIIKSVFCSYRGILIVYGLHGKVKELSGEFTLEKAERIKELSNENTEFDGRDLYNQLVSEALTEKQKKGKLKSTVPSVPSAQMVYTFTIENTSKKTLPVVLFGGNDFINAINFGNVNGIAIDKPNDYSQFLAQSMVKPVIIKTIQIQNTDKTGGVIAINKKNPLGGTSSSILNLGNPNQYNFQQNITQLQNLNLVLDGSTEFNFDLSGNSKTTIQLVY